MWWVHLPGARYSRALAVAPTPSSSRSSPRSVLPGRSMLTALAGLRFLLRFGVQGPAAPTTLFAKAACFGYERALKSAGRRRAAADARPPVRFPGAADHRAAAGQRHAGRADPDPGLFHAGLAYLLNRRLGVAHKIAGPSALIGASNFFEMALATAVGLFGIRSGAALATVVGVLIEVPVMLSVVAIVNGSRAWYSEGEKPALMSLIVLPRASRNELLQVGNSFLLRKEGHDVCDGQAVALLENKELFFCLFHGRSGWAALGIESRQLCLEAAKGVGGYGHASILSRGLVVITDQGLRNHPSPRPGVSRRWRLAVVAWICTLH